MGIWNKNKKRWYDGPFNSYLTIVRHSLLKKHIPTISIEEFLYGLEKMINHEEGWAGKNSQAKVKTVWEINIFPSTVQKISFLQAGN